MEIQRKSACCHKIYALQEYKEALMPISSTYQRVLCVYQQRYKRCYCKCLCDYVAKIPPVSYQSGVMFAFCQNRLIAPTSLVIAKQPEKSLN